MPRVTTSSRPKRCHHHLHSSCVTPSPPPCSPGEQDEEALSKTAAASGSAADLQAMYSTERQISSKVRGGRVSGRAANSRSRWRERSRHCD